MCYSTKLIDNCAAYHEEGAFVLVGYKAIEFSDDGQPLSRQVPLYWCPICERRVRFVRAVGNPTVQHLGAAHAPISLTVLHESAATFGYAGYNYPLGRLIEDPQHGFHVAATIHEAVNLTGLSEWHIQARPPAYKPIVKVLVPQHAVDKATNHCWAMLMLPPGRLDPTPAEISSVARWQPKAKRLQRLLAERYRSAFPMPALVSLPLKEKENV